MSARDSTIKDIDTKLAEARELYKKAEYWSRLLGTIDNNIRVLERAKALLVRDDMPPEPEAVIPVWDEYPASPKTPATDTESGDSEKSIGAQVIAILTEARSALPVQTILERLHSSKGRTDVTPKTLAGVLSQYLAKGTIRRVARATYALPA